MPKGTVKWFNSQKGCGLIQPQGGGKAVFVHISAVERAGLSDLDEGQIVEFEEVSSKGKTPAENLKVHYGLWSGSRQPITAASTRLPVSILFHTPSSHLHRNGRT